LIGQDIAAVRDLLVEDDLVLGAIIQPGNEEDARAVPRVKERIPASASCGTASHPEALSARNSMRACGQRCRIVRTCAADGKMTWCRRVTLDVNNPGQAPYREYASFPCVSHYAC